MSRLWYDPFERCRGSAAFGADDRIDAPPPCDALPQQGRAYQKHVAALRQNRTYDPSAHGPRHRAFPCRLPLRHDG